MLNDQELNEALAKSPKECVTKGFIEQRIDAVEYQKLGATGTLCRIQLKNGFQTIGHSACVNPEHYNQEIGERIAYDDAFKQLWPLYGFVLAEKNYLSA